VYRLGALTAWGIAKLGRRLAKASPKKGVASQRCRLRKASGQYNFYLTLTLTFGQRPGTVQFKFFKFFPIFGKLRSKIVFFLGS